jgi:hypothetical protein
MDAAEERDESLRMIRASANPASTAPSGAK